MISELSRRRNREIVYILYTDTQRPKHAAPPSLAASHVAVDRVAESLCGEQLIECASLSKRWELWLSVLPKPKNDPSPQHALHHPDTRIRPHSCTAVKGCNIFPVADYQFFFNFSMFSQVSEVSGVFVFLSGFLGFWCFFIIFMFFNVFKYL